MALSRMIAALSLTGWICISVSEGLPGASPASPAAEKVTKKSGANYQIEKVKEWRALIAQHEPGKADPAAVAIGSWPSKDIKSAVSFVTKLAGQSAGSLKRSLGKARIRRALNLTDEEVKLRDLNRILKLGAILHTDVALLGLETWEYQDIGEATGAFADGRILIMPKKHHWEFARQLIGSITSQDPMARQWYIAITAHMQSRRLLGYAGQNVKLALERFPSDDRLLFYAGVLHELWASPANQNILLPKQAKVTYGNKASELKLARQYFEKAVAVNPGFVEARLHLGRILSLLGQHTQAIAELQQTAASIGDPRLSYYASLYLGHEFEITARPEEARKHYEHAAALYPAAQSPWLALSQLARNNDDTRSAWIAIQRVFALPRNDQWEDDPWWVYDLAHVRDADALVAEMQNAFGGLPK
ncbi:MAG: tetratricopeptide repeat protein [Acidobacteria bacterium]|nr:tetratricopeptide repeat protein [Acidobacteriota bacterium]